MVGNRVRRLLRKCKNQIEFQKSLIMKRNAAVWLIQSHKYVDVDTFIKRVEH